ncbi:MAG: hypothetical protein A2329_00375 [Sulfurimonas sp. RIFOXYB2_FULL_37_5]|uniref:hypothetical protein n=1 Tax=Sulfurimonas sp. RIFOXYB12_FULL_35_9 TaxID=1802256 RepID=UPI0008D8C9B7|nr:hypothetical protein [Sulfurimonas sp. RIFOXYB12_FULL_35_9]OHE04197.1 MAG: hypothetical protein A2345_00570 [Sulfurimonas sp. RIFOXYB12_FULL_35_9]OHE15442.1 MAG: hypothetical protein A2329_00375 [Sulfurimonas sp. RIFOXYB2_FULL_37_5]
MKNIFFKLFTFLLFTLSANSSEFDVKAFGTLGGVYNDNSDYIYRKDIFQKDGSSDDLSFKTDTVVGLQTTLHVNENFSALLQGIANNDYDDKVRAKIDWGYLKYDSNENITLKFGRIRTPYYKNSENLNIGYSNLMIRESVEVYGQVPFSSYNGVEITYSNIIGTYFYTIQGGYGREELTVPNHSLNQEANVNIDDLYAINLTFGTTALQTRVTYINADITAVNQSLNQLFAGLRAFGLDELADQYEHKNKQSEYLGFGIFLDYKNILFSSEYGQRRLNSFSRDLHGYYATVGYSFHKLIPFITYAKSEMDNVTYGANTVSPILNNLLRSQNTAQSSKTVGIKYYLNENFDIKFQYENIIPKGDFGSYHLSSLQKPQELNVFSFALDFVF